MTPAEAADHKAMAPLMGADGSGAASASSQHNLLGTAARACALAACALYVSACGRLAGRQAGLPQLTITGMACAGVATV